MTEQKLVEKKDNKLLYVLIGLCVLLVISMFAFGSSLSNANKTDSAKLASLETKINSIPSGLTTADVQSVVASEIAKIPAPTAAVSTPTEVNLDVDVQKLNQIWEKEYSAEIEVLEDAADEAANEELGVLEDNEDLEDFFKAGFPGLDEILSVDVKDTHTTVLALGLEEDEDKVVEIVYDLKVKYTLEEGADDTLKKLVTATVKVTFNEGDLEDEDVEVIFA
jgi:hypothetical protein